MAKNIWYAVYDSRYHYDPDAALVLDTSDSLEGAWEAAKMQGNGNVVVKMEDRADGISYPIEGYYAPPKKRRTPEQPR